MKTSEFIKNIRELGFSLKNNHEVIRVYPDNPDWSCWFVEIGNSAKGILTINTDDLDTVNQEHFKAFKLAVDYAFTPIDKREDEPKFKVRLTPLSNSLDSLWIGARNDDLDVTSWSDAVAFTPTQYHLFPDNHPEWKPFLHDYDPNNTAVFVPVEDN